MKFQKQEKQSYRKILSYAATDYTESGQKQVQKKSLPSSWPALRGEAEKKTKKRKTKSLLWNESPVPWACLIQFHSIIQLLNVFILPLAI